MWLLIKTPSKFELVTQVDRKRVQKHNEVYGCKIEFAIYDQLKSLYKIVRNTKNFHLIKYQCLSLNGRQTDGET